MVAWRTLQRRSRYQTIHQDPVGLESGSFCGSTSSTFDHKDILAGRLQLSHVAGLNLTGGGFCHSQPMPPFTIGTASPDPMVLFRRV
ncbi:hypothetical protein HZH68_000894 [Vespula germanica]|uniref:Uncharacterized protein n=1 Tax=Vespula germanica TaxID=30212 RepID=A0A834NUH6_VESGE|nr:hypothetical protein HZH68_000894 [Vespula germanica]